MHAMYAEQCMQREKEATWRVFVSASAVFGINSYWEADMLHEKLDISLCIN